jgi:phosphoglycerate dehydrogenase-like enzyme
MIIAITVESDVAGGMNVTDRHVDMVREVFPEAEIHNLPYPPGIMKQKIREELIDKGIKADILFCSLTTGHFYAEEYVYFNDRLKWIHDFSAGYEALMSVDPARLAGIRFSNAANVHNVPISDHAFCFILALLRKLPQLIENKRTGQIARLQLEEAEGKTLLILGVGNIGRLIARKAKAFDMRVTGFKRRMEVVEFVDQIYSESELDVALAEADIVLSTLPLSAETREFMNAARFRQMKNTAYFINIGRGGTVDEPALVEALEEGIIAGAAIDVASREPIPPDSLLKAKNLIYSPHIAASNPRAVDRIFANFQENTRAYLAGERMPTEFDLDH